jgi:uncharacterized protein (DUF1501 family)
MTSHSRRSFLKKSTLATAGTMLIPGFLKALEANQLVATPAHNRKLVIVQLSGGNDGLNTIVPYRNDIYYRERPDLAIPSDKVLQINDEIGFNPALAPLRELFDKGLMTIVNNVGYPNPDRSHSRSLNIWHTASDSDSYGSTGWIGRYLDAQCSTDCFTSSSFALELDDSLSLAMKGDKVKGLAVLNPYRFHQQAHHPYFEQVSTLSRATPINDHASYLYKTLAETLSSADAIYAAWKSSDSNQETKRGTYPESEFGKRLKTIAELISSDIQTQVYYVSLSGFDTHVNQLEQQNRLLTTYAEAMSAFTNELEENNQLDDVMIMTFSEFGRGVKQNASQGTDHGTANNLFLMNGRLKKGRIFNEAANLVDLNEGDLKHTIDFRNIYATLLRQWLKVDDVAILGRKFDTLGFV